MWQWLWVDNVDHISESSVEDVKSFSPSLESSSASSSHNSGSNNPQPVTLHGVVFKCIGCTCVCQRQDILEEVTELLSRNEDVPVNIYPEPENKKDSQAIVFKCYIRGKWHIIGYVVREALDDVHDALRNDAITEIKFAWAQYGHDQEQVSMQGSTSQEKEGGGPMKYAGVVAPSDGHILDLTLN